MFTVVMWRKANTAPKFVLHLSNAIIVACVVLVAALLGGGALHEPAVTKQPVPLSPEARLGKRMFFDPSLSASGTVSCGTCHDPKHAFAQPPNQGAIPMGGLRQDSPGFRNAPSLCYLAWTPPFALATRDGKLVPVGGFTRRAIGRSPPMQIRATSISVCADRFARIWRSTTSFVVRSKSPHCATSLSLHRIYITGSLPHCAKLSNSTSLAIPIRRDGMRLRSSAGDRSSTICQSSMLAMSIPARSPTTGIREISLRSIPAR